MSELENINLHDLIGMTLKRDDVIVEVSWVSLGPPKTVYIHQQWPFNFGWTFMSPDGKLAGNWEIVMRAKTNDRP